jgi:hypothetical protein
MDKTREKEITKLKFAGLLFGTGLAASIHFGIRLIPFENNQAVTTDELLRTARPSHHADQTRFQIPLP